MALHSASLLNRGFRQLGNGLLDVLDMFTLPSTEIKQSRKVFTRNARPFFKGIFLFFICSFWKSSLKVTRVLF